jgi:hypothetical protein
MARSTIPATIAITYEARSALKRLTTMIGYAADKPVTYSVAITEAEKIVRERLYEELAKQELAKAGAT